MRPANGLTVKVATVAGSSQGIGRVIAGRLDGLADRPLPGPAAGRRRS